jgi:hypothetical protein
MQSDICFGLQIVSESLMRHGFKVENWNENSQGQIIASVYWGDQILDLIRFRKKYGLPKDGIIVGGLEATSNPAALLPFVESAFLGDGDNWDGVDQTHIVTESTTEPKEIKTERIIPTCYQDVQSNRRSFIEIARGCHGKCLFCQYTWIKKYRELDIADIRIMINKAKTKSIRVFCSDRFGHSQWPEIKSYLTRIKKNDTGTDVTARAILSNPDLLQTCRKVRLGIEGMSPRLRKMVGKPLSNDEIIEIIKLIQKAGLKTIDWYMIYGLPTETKEDWDSFRTLLDGIAAAISIESFTLAIHWNAFSPKAMTPFQWAKPCFNYDPNFKGFMSDVRYPKLKVYHKPLLTSDATMIMRTLTGRAGIKTAPLLYNVALNGAIIKKRPELILSEFKKRMGFDLMGELPADLELPWDRFVQYDKPKFRKIYEHAIN